MTAPHAVILMSMFVAVFIFFLLAPWPAQAYLDPGTGSYITQIAIGFLVGGGYLLKVYFEKIRLFFSNVKKLLLNRVAKKD